MFPMGALGAGLDINGILDVLYVGRPYRMTDYVKESGQGAGRVRGKQRF